MNLVEKKKKLSEIRADLERGMFQNGRVENVGSVFFVYNMGACVLRDVVYYRSKAIGLDFEVLCMSTSYFIGTKAHAEALKEAYGGSCYPTEYCYCAENARDLYAWEGPQRREQLLASYHGESTPLDLEEVKTILFS